MDSSALQEKIKFLDQVVSDLIDESDATVEKLESVEEVFFSGKKLF